MALKRKTEKKYGLDEMFFMINHKFITEQRSQDVSISTIPHYTLSPTCFENTNKRWLMSDGRDLPEDEECMDRLPDYYGATIIDVVTETFEKNRRSRNG